MKVEWGGKIRGRGEAWGVEGRKSSGVSLGLGLGPCPSLWTGSGVVFYSHFSKKAIKTCFSKGSLWPGTATVKSNAAKASWSCFVFSKSL